MLKVKGECRWPEQLTDSKDSVNISCFYNWLTTVVSKTFLPLTGTRNKHKQLSSECTFWQRLPVLMIFVETFLQGSSFTWLLQTGLPTALDKQSHVYSFCLELPPR